MKIVLPNLFLFYSCVTLILSSCKSEDNYNWKDIGPENNLLAELIPLKETIIIHMNFSQFQEEAQHTNECIKRTSQHNSG